MDLFQTKNKELSIVENSDKLYIIASDIDGDYEETVDIRVTIDELKDIHAKLGQFIQEAKGSKQ